MSQVSVCSYCYLMQREERLEPLALSQGDVRRYVEHLKFEHGVTLDPEIHE